jgi:thioesterase domain-containing protein/acyl carrier protein
LRLGTHWHGRLEVSECRGSHVVGRIALGDQHGPEAGQWLLHPSLLDMAIGAAVHLLAPRVGDLVVPMSFRRVQVVSALPAEVEVRVVQRSRSDEMGVVDLELLDAHGVRCLVIEGLALRSVHSELALATDADPVAARFSGLGLLALVELAGLDHAEGAEAFVRALKVGAPQVLVSKLHPSQLLAEVAPAPHDTPSSGPAPAVEGDRATRAVTEAWMTLLGVQSAQPNDDFFAMGGHSLIAVRLFTRLHGELGVRLALTTLFETPTLGGLIARVRAEVGDEEPDAGPGPTASSDGAGAAPSAARPRTAASCLVPIKSNGEAPALLCVHGRGGNVLGFSDFGRAMPPRRPFYGVQAFAVTGDRMPDRTIVAMASRYTDGLLESGLELPVHLAGYSGGGLIALEMARILLRKGLPIGSVVLLDTFHPAAQALSRRAKLTNVARNTAMRGPGAVGRWAKGYRAHRAELAAMADFVDDPGFAAAGIVDLSDFFDVAAVRHRFEPLDADVHLITVEEFDATVPPDNGWHDSDFPALHRHRVPGNHLDMLSGSRGSSLAVLVDQLLG